MRIWRSSLVVALFLCALCVPAQTPTKVTISEPGIYPIDLLFARADRVALVKVVAGNAVAYDVAIYKAEVIQGFKGLSSGESLYFGPYLGTELGSEYLLFLKDVAKPVEPKSKADSAFGVIRYSAVFDEGYSSMLSSYQCLFDGDRTDQMCDYGLRVCTDYIKLPKELPAFPKGDPEPPFGCRWVRKSRFLSFLDILAANPE